MLFNINHVLFVHFEFKAEKRGCLIGPIFSLSLKRTVLQKKFENKEKITILEFLNLIFFDISEPLSSNLQNFFRRLSFFQDYIFIFGIFFLIAKKKMCPL